MERKTPQIEGHITVGKVQHAHGIRGELFLFVFAKEADWLKKLETVVLLDESGQALRLPVVSKRWHKDGIIVKVEGVDDRNRAEELKGRFFAVPEDFFVSAPGENFYLREILHFQLKSPDGANLGQIEGFSSNGAQDLAMVTAGEREHLIPLIDDWIVEINREEKYIVMDLPEGLFE